MAANRRRRRRSPAATARRRGTSPPNKSLMAETWDLWRPVLALLLVAVSMSFAMFVEDHPKAAARGFGVLPAADEDSSGILDTGFVLTKWSFDVLKANAYVNDIAAFANTLLVLSIVGYISFVTFWNGDYGLVARIIFTQVLRGFSGWFTYLPPPRAFLCSKFDVPELFSSGVLSQGWQHFIGSFGRAEEPVTIIPFVCFFSGHVANTVIAANHLYLNGSKRWGITLHALNVLQIFRLLSTRGHYSIDILVGWIVAIHVSSPAEKIGRWYSRASANELAITLSNGSQRTAEQVFESLIRAKDNRVTSRYAGKEAPIPKPALRHAADAVGEALEGAGAVATRLRSRASDAIEEAGAVATRASTRAAKGFRR